MELRWSQRTDQLGILGHGGYNVAVAKYPPLLGLTEMAERYRTNRQNAYKWSKVDGFPAAELEMHAGKFWRQSAVDGWVSEHRPEHFGHLLGGSAATK